MLDQIVRGPLLIPQDNGRVIFHPDGALAGDEQGMLCFAGAWRELGDQPITPRQSEGVMLPPLIDIHIHIPQHPIRGRFIEGIRDDAPEGKLLAGLQRNVFPVEARCRVADHAQKVVEQFQRDTLAHGVVGGAAYMTPSVLATEIALANLPGYWSVGLVMMNQNCPLDLRIDEPSFEANVGRLAQRFGRRLIMTDRFAVVVDTALRKKGVALARRYGLRTQTHLNEQLGEKALVETTLYPEAGNYTEVYHGDGLLDHECIVAHCVHMRPDEWRILADTGAAIAHCPTSNLILGSGVMCRKSAIEHKIPFAIGTDVGASPTVSMLAEMGRFLSIHPDAAPAEALFRATLAPAGILGLTDLGRLQPGKPMSFIEVLADSSATDSGAADPIRSLLPADLDRPKPAVRRVTLKGRLVFRAEAPHA